MSATTMILRLTTDGHERQDAQHRTIMSGDMRRNGLEASQAVAVRHPNIARSGPVMAEPSSAQAAQEKDPHAPGVRAGTEAPPDDPAGARRWGHRRPRHAGKVSRPVWIRVRRRHGGMTQATDDRPAGR
jgi:hypothetical protein